MTNAVSYTPYRRNATLVRGSLVENGYRPVPLTPPAYMPEIPRPIGCCPFGTVQSNQLTVRGLKPSTKVTPEMIEAWDQHKIQLFDNEVSSMTTGIWNPGVIIDVEVDLHTLERTQQEAIDPILGAIEDVIGQRIYDVPICVGPQGCSLIFRARRALRKDSKIIGPFRMPGQTWRANDRIRILQKEGLVAVDGISQFRVRKVGDEVRLDMRGTYTDRGLVYDDPLNSVTPMNTPKNALPFIEQQEIDDIHARLLDLMSAEGMQEIRDIPPESGPMVFDLDTEAGYAVAGQTVPYMDLVSPVAGTTASYDMLHADLDILSPVAGETFEIRHDGKVLVGIRDAEGVNHLPQEIRPPNMSEVAAEGREQLNEKLAGYFGLRRG